MLSGCGSRIETADVICVAIMIKHTIRYQASMRHASLSPVTVITNHMRILCFFKQTRFFFFVKMAEEQLGNGMALKISLNEERVE